MIIGICKLFKKKYQGNQSTGNGSSKHCLAILKRCISFTMSIPNRDACSSISIKN